VELVCNRVAIIKKGTLLASAPIGELLAHGQRLQLRVDNKPTAMEILRKLAFVKGVIEDNGYLKVETPVENAAQINKALVEAGIQVSELCRSGENLEDVFLQMTGGENGG
jgi:ABC-2 type transport system ATP-binding protein